jgi:hypothetical protein
MFEENDLIAMFGMFDVTGSVHMACVFVSLSVWLYCSRGREPKP